MADGQSEMERKKADVRARLEAQTQSKKKKGFMTPERKKKLRLLLRKKAAEELKKEQERKAAERRRVIDERCGRAKPLDNLGEVEVKSICKGYYERICQVESAKYDMEKEVEFKDYQVQDNTQLKKLCLDYFDRLFDCESQKFDLEHECRRKEYEINELNIAVNDLRGKFIKPTLKKVSKYENKFAKLQKKAAEFNFRNQLKTVKKKEFTMDEEEPGEHKKPDWALEGNKPKAGLDASNEAVAAADTESTTHEPAIAETAAERTEEGEKLAENSTDSPASVQQEQQNEAHVTDAHASDGVDNTNDSPLDTNVTPSEEVAA